MNDPQKRGYDDEMSNKVDFALFNSDAAPEARCYRDGVRTARRDKRDRLEPVLEQVEELIISGKVEVKMGGETIVVAPPPLSKAQLEEAFPTNPTTTVTETKIEIRAEAEPASEVPPGSSQLSLLDVDPDWKAKWKSMPEFEQRDLTPWQSVKVNFACHADRVSFAKLLGQTITDDTRSLWHPKAAIGHFVDRHYTAEEKVLPKYPVYVISKGRWESRLTVKSLEKIGVPYHVVIEPQEFPQYSAVIDPAKILILPFSNLGQGSIPARNWVWEHALGIGAERHWILDDNIDGFFRLHDNLKVPVSTGSTFRAAEDFVDRYTNVALAGFQYFMFAPRKAVMPPFTLNTRIYSCILIRNDLTHRWRGRYNEDTDLSIRILKDGFCTVLFNAFLAFKMTTMTMGGGNTDELYKDDGRKKMAESLRDQHPELVKIVWKWNRWQHHVDYRVFKDNRMIERLDYVPDATPNNYGMKLEFHADRKDDELADVEEIQDQAEAAAAGVAPIESLATPPPVPIATPEPQPLPSPPKPEAPAASPPSPKRPAKPADELFELDFR